MNLFSWNRDNDYGSFPLCLLDLLMSKEIALHLLYIRYVCTSIAIMSHEAAGTK